MRVFYYLLAVLLMFTSVAKAEVITSDSGALAIMGSACEDVKPDEQNASTRIKAMDKACFNALNSLSEIINIKDSFDEHDFNVMIYNIVDEYIEDLTTKTIKQDNSQICVEVSGYVTADNIGKAIDSTLKEPLPEKSEKTTVETGVMNNEVVEEVKAVETGDNNEEKEVNEPKEPNDLDGEDVIDRGLISPNKPYIQDAHVVVLSTIFIEPTEFYNGSYSHRHSQILKHVLEAYETIKIVKHKSEANFIISPKVLKARVETINSETSRMQMVVALEMFDKNKNETVTEHQNKFVLFNNNDDEQTVARSLLAQLFEQASTSIVKRTGKSSQKALEKHPKPVSIEAL